jgi:hypothetical protein
MVIQNTVDLANKLGLWVFIRVMLRNCCSPTARVFPIIDFQNGQSNTSRVNLQPLMQKRKHQWQNFLQKSSSTASPWLWNLWIRPQIMTLIVRGDLRHGEMFLKWYAATENCFWEKTQEMIINFWCLHYEEAEVHGRPTAWSHIWSTIKVSDFPIKLLIM